MGTVDFSTMDLEKKKRRMGSPQSENRWNGIMHQDQQIDRGASQQKNHRRRRKPPGLHALLQAKEGSRGKRKKTHRREDDEGEDAIEGSEAENQQRKPRLQ
jgi:hypothetical protein